MKKVHVCDIKVTTVLTLDEKKKSQGSYFRSMLTFSFSQTFCETYAITKNQYLPSVLCYKFFWNFPHGYIMLSILMLINYIHLPKQITNKTMWWYKYMKYCWKARFPKHKNNDGAELVLECSGQRKHRTKLTVTQSSILGSFRFHDGWLLRRSNCKTRLIRKLTHAHFNQISH